MAVDIERQPSPRAATLRPPLRLEIPRPEDRIGAAEREAPVEAPATEAVPAPAAPQRLLSLDAYRGLVMVLMVSAGLGIGAVVRNFDKTPELQSRATPAWRFLAWQTDHAPWVGCTLWDLIQPSFMFMVGAALPFSIASRRAKGQSFRKMLVHALIRSVVLIFLGVFLVSHGRITNWTFETVLSQIGLGYPFLFLLAWVRARWQFVAAVAILAAYWGAFALYPAPPADLDLAKYNLPPTWHRLEGFASHWEKNTNFAARVDQSVVGAFPHEKPFAFSEGGYPTLNFVPSLATMIFGLMAGELLRGRLRAGWKIAVMLAAAAVGLAAGWALNHYGLCPLVKRIWTPSWALFSAGWAFLLLAAFYLVIDVVRLRKWAMPLAVVGMNSIAIYCISMLLRPWFREAVQRHAGPNAFDVFGTVYAPMAQAGFFLLFCWLAAWWMYRQKIFVKV